MWKEGVVRSKFFVGVLWGPVFFRRSPECGRNIYTFPVGEGAVMFQLCVCIFQRLLSCAPLTNKSFTLLANPRVTESSHPVCSHVHYRVIYVLKCCVHDVNGNFHWRNPSGRTTALGSTKPLTEMSNRNIYRGGKGGRCLRLITLPLSFCLPVCYPKT